MISAWPESFHCPTIDNYTWYLHTYHFNNVMNVSYLSDSVFHLSAWSVVLETWLTHYWYYYWTWKVLNLQNFVFNILESSYLEGDCLLLWLLSLLAEPHLDKSRKGCLLSGIFPPAGGTGDEEDRLEKTLLLTLDLETGLTVCLPSSILFMTASHRLGFLTRGVLCFTFSSFSVSIAWVL